MLTLHLCGQSKFRRACRSGYLHRGAQVSDLNDCVALRTEGYVLKS